MVVSTFDIENVGGRPRGVGDIRPLPPKHYSPIYFDLSDIGVVYGGIVANRSSCGKLMVVEGSIGYVGSAGDSKCVRSGVAEKGSQDGYKTRD